MNKETILKEFEETHGDYFSVRHNGEREYFVTTKELESFLDQYAEHVLAEYKKELIRWTENNWGLGTSKTLFSEDAAKKILITYLRK